ncbi:MAG TPA: hypothetical protein DC049_19645, partial [Spirochaetia bacterium]|nr:hypothetical protein [Spirochaetia bacterium]
MKNREELPQVNGKYRITELLQETLNSSLYLAETPDAVQVCVKILKKDQIRGAEDIIRFKKEAEILAALQHENIIKIMESGQYLDTCFIVREYIEGITLREYTEKPGLETAEKIVLLKTIAGAVDYIHSRNILLGDLTDENIIIDIRGGIKLIDFGLSNFRDHILEKQINNISGTLAFMAPEQIGIIKKNIDSRADLYSLGIIAFRLLTGRLPFDGSLSEVVHKHAAMNPPPLALLPDDADHTLETIIHKLLQKDPDNRYQKARELITDLEKYADGARFSAYGKNSEK